MRAPVVLTIAGFDPSSGAGITADLRAIAANKCYGISCITAFTVQSTVGVAKSQPVEPKLVRETLVALAEDIEISAIKVGMLGAGAVAEVAAEFLEGYRGPVVLDPVLRSSSGAELADSEAVEVLRERLLPRATVITPNAMEAAELAGIAVGNRPEAESAARLLSRSGGAVIITGGHLADNADLVFSKEGAVWLEGPRVGTGQTHGTGCAYSSALACGLAKGLSVVAAARAAKEYVAAAVRESPDVGRGKFRPVG